MLNFTYSEKWIKGIQLRYAEADLLVIKDCYFVKTADGYRFCHFFEIEKAVINSLANLINNNQQIEFRYVNEASYQLLKNYALINRFNCKINDIWEAPQLLTNKFVGDYIEHVDSKQLKKNYKQYLLNASAYDFVIANPTNVEQLWLDVKKIDNYSWKKRENSDMISLAREDLQYYPALIDGKFDLVVMYKNQLPLAYSLAVNDNGLVYMIKWGASDEGRKHNAGFYALFYHLNLLGKNTLIDFWGRRSATYSRLANRFENRYNVVLEKGDSDVL